MARKQSANVAAKFDNVLAEQYRATAKRTARHCCKIYYYAIKLGKGGHNRPKMEQTIEKAMSLAELVRNNEMLAKGGGSKQWNDTLKLDKD